MRLTIIDGSREAKLLARQVPGANLIDESVVYQGFDADAVIDATHPCEQYARYEISEQIGSIPLLQLQHKPWHPTVDDKWINITNTYTTRAAVSSLWQRIFLCLGERDRSAFTGDPHRWYLVRTRPPGASLPPQHEVTARTGPFTVEQETALMQHHEVDVLVTRNAGGDGALPKVLAARALSLPVVMMSRPEASVPEVATIDEALAWLDSLSLD